LGILLGSFGLKGGFGMRTARIVGEAGSFYHVVSRVVDRQMVFDCAAKETLRGMLRRVADFCGIRVITYALLDNHFHILMQVPVPQSITDEELIRRIGVLYGDQIARNIEISLQTMVKAGEEKQAAELREKYLYRMWNMAEFMKTLKQRVSIWQNRNRHRKGTLWEERYKSVLVEGKQNALAAVAAYIDLNAVRAGIVADPKDYRYCGYGEAVGGGKEARDGLGFIMATLGQASDWRRASAEYRKFLYQKGEKTQKRHGIEPEKVQEVLAAGGKLGLVEALRCRVRYFSDGVALGSKEYVNGVFAKHRDKFGKARQDGARKLRWGEWDGLCSLRDLRVNVISAPG